MSLAHKILNKYWGHSDFRPFQKEIIDNVLEKKDTVALLATGGGKSVCFQVPAMCMDGVCIVISPLIALMEDQVENLNKKNIKAVYIKSSLRKNDIITLFDNIRFNDIKFIYLSPERLQSEVVQQKLSQLSPCLIAIDEAHCISQWGHDFRPSYLNISDIKKIHPDTPTIALTATATSEVIKDISKHLEFKEFKVFRSTFDRENLAYKIVYTEDKLGKLFSVLNTNKSSSIVYVNTRGKTKDIANFLNNKGIKSAYYHGGLTANQKKEAYDSWINEDVSNIVSTNAFGMGIDKGNVSMVIHIDSPASIENYIQEAGRAGRDGNQSVSYLLNSHSDKARELNKYNDSLANIEAIKNIYSLLIKKYRIIYGELSSLRHQFNFQEFIVTNSLSPLLTYNCLKALDRELVISYTEKSSDISSVKIQVIDIHKYLRLNKSHTELINFILRNYTGILDDSVNINEFYIAKNLKRDKKDIISELKILAYKNIIYYNYKKSEQQIEFLKPREDNYTINSISRNVKLINKIKKQKLSSILKYIDNNDICRAIVLLDYFSENKKEKCGICDICIINKTDIETIKNTILTYLKDNKKETISSLINNFDYSKLQVSESIENLIIEDKITLTNNTYININEKQT